MSAGVQQLAAPAVLARLAQLFAQPASDRHVYLVFGPYARLRPFQAMLRQQTEAGNLNAMGRVDYLSLNAAIPLHLSALGALQEAEMLADRRRDQELAKRLSASFRDLVTRRIEPADVAGLVLADFELLYAYGLGANDLTLARQVAINGKRVCLLVPGAIRDGRLWIFDEDDESREEFPPALVFVNSGWVFELLDETGVWRS
jgi:hypothetical protein